MPIVGNLTTESLLIALSGIVTVFLMLAGLSVFIVVISRAVNFFEKKPATAGGPPAQPAAPASARQQPAPAPRPVPMTAQTAPYGGSVALSGVDDLTAACIMAIVSDETGIPLSELVFQSIKAL